MTTGQGQSYSKKMMRSTTDWRRFDLPYYSPHKFRHGHAVYALKNAKDVPALKAVSQNLMHANISTTDGIYGVLSETDVREQIDLLGRDSENKNRNLEERIERLERIIESEEGK